MAAIKHTENNIIQILEGLNFELELNTWNDDAYEENRKFMRFRHHKAPDEREFALIIWKNEDLQSALVSAETMLRKVGQYQKLQQLSKLID